MAVKVEILNKLENNSRESLAAKDLKQMILDSMPQNVSGVIHIAYSITMCGQDPRDLDLLLMCKLDGYRLEKYYTNDSKYPKKDLIVDDFCCAIELKEHPDDRVEIRDSCVYVKYHGQDKNATEQNEGQRYSLANYLWPLCKTDLFISNFVWLKSLSSEELRRKHGIFPIGALPHSFGFKAIVNMCLLQGHKPYYSNGDNCYHLSSDIYKSGIDYPSIIKSGLFTGKPVPSQFTMNKITRLMETKVENRLNQLEIGRKCIEFQGKAGTGKTFFLIQSALRMANEGNGNRCLILTYNHALVSDIRRLLYFMDIPDGIDENTVQICTLHSFFIHLMKSLRIDTYRIYGTQFNYEYEKALRELEETITDLMDEKDIKVLKEDNKLAIDWDYIFIDEAQDWHPYEKIILEKVYGKSHLIIANGLTQYMRRNKPLFWGGEIEPLVYSRRQKSNLVEFVNKFAKEAGLKWATKNDRDFLGGKVIIRSNYDDDLHRELVENCSKNGCDNYEILFLVPPEMVIVDKNGNRQFKNKAQFEEAEIDVFDGTNERQKCCYTADATQCRLYQYESCRGLESWGTVCMKLDLLYDYKIKDFVDSGDTGLVKKTPQQRLHDYVFTWLLMPLTRAIDTLIITIKDSDSEIGQILKRVANQMPDIVSWEVNSKS